jgi:hypothetical protein
VIVLTFLWFAVMGLLAACGEDNGNNDTLFTGLSGVVIVVIIGWLIYRAWNKTRG